MKLSEIKNATKKIELNLNLKVEEESKLSNYQ